MGFIIPKPVNGCYWVDKESPYFREISELLHFSREEAYILQKAIHSIDNENTLKANLVSKLYALYDFNRVADTIVKREQSYNVHALLNAIKARKQVVLEAYKSANSNFICDRRVEPFGFTTNYVSVWAYDMQTDSCKTFKIARIKAVKTLPENWAHEAKHKELPLDVFRIGSNNKINVTLSLSLRAYELLIEEYPLSERYITENNKSYIFDGWVGSFEGVGRFILGLCGEIEVVKPTSLKKFVKEKAKRNLQ
ncbi:MAG: WYL domain-containing protein [Chlorobi bacterium]|nr:WYL domain-containing protein [Chlorobiota bacterium]